MEGLEMTSIPGFHAPFMAADRLTLRAAEMDAWCPAVMEDAEVIL